MGNILPKRGESSRRKKIRIYLQDGYNTANVSPDTKVSSMRVNLPPRLLWKDLQKKNNYYKKKRFSRINVMKRALPGVAHYVDNLRKAKLPYEGQML
jgi:hypothetical protein